MAGMTQRIEEFFRQRYPWLVADFNGATWETSRERQERRVTALEEHMRNLEDRYADLENRLLDHAQGQKHKRAIRKPEEG